MVKQTDLTQTFKDLAKLGGMSTVLSDNWESITRPEIERVLKQRAGRVRSSKGNPSRLGYALLRSNPVDPQWRWRRTPQGGDLVMSQWVSRAAYQMIELTPSDLDRIVKEVVRRSWRR